MIGCAATSQPAYGPFTPGVCRVCACWARSYLPPTGSACGRDEPRPARPRAYSAESCAGNWPSGYRNTMTDQSTYDYFAKHQPWSGTYWPCPRPTLPRLHDGRGDRLRELRRLRLRLAPLPHRPPRLLRSRPGLAARRRPAALHRRRPRVLVRQRQLRPAIARRRERRRGHCRHCGYDLLRHAGPVPGMRYIFRGNRRLKHRLFNFLMVLALLLCVAVISLWVRSHWVSDYAVLIDNEIERPHDHGELSREFEFQSARAW